MFPRKIYQQLKAHLDEKEITVLTGMRRTGKTTLVKQLLNDIASDNKIYIDLQILANQDLFSPRNFDAIVENLKQRKININERAYVVLDEIQLVKEIPGILKYINDNYNIKFIVTGSSSYYLKNLFAESLAGRKKIFELFPLDFGEFLVFKGVKAEEINDWRDHKFDAAEYSWLHAYYDEFSRFGGFPQVVLSESENDKQDRLNEILTSYVNTDIASLADFADRKDAFTLMKMLSGRIGTKLDYSKLSRLSGISRARVKDYLELFVGTYLVSTVPVFTNNPDKEIVKAEKLYFCDSGLVGILSDVGSGAKFENTVYSQLRQRGNIQYFSLKTGKEIDFIFDGKLALEVKETPTITDLNNLSNLSSAAGIADYRLIGKNQLLDFGDYIWGGSIR